MSCISLRHKIFNANHLQCSGLMSILLQQKTSHMKPIISTRIASIIYALAIGIFGILHFINADTMKTAIPDYIPGGVLWVYITGAGMILAAIAIIINKLTRLACYLLALMLLIFVFTLHLKPLLSGNFIHLLKDTGLAMAAIMIGNNASDK